jgi:hypothetical protein
MKTPILMSLLLVSAAAASPASANYFHNPYTNIYLNVGSAPTPTPADIREDRLPQVAVDPSNSDVATADETKAPEKTAAAPAAPEQTFAQAGGAQAAPQASPSR